VQHQAERSRNVRRQGDGLAGNLDPRGIVGDIGLELPERQGREIGAPPIGFHRQRVRVGERGEPAVEARDEIVARRAVALGLMRDRLDDGQRVLNAVRQLLVRSRLSAFMRFCSANTIRPAEVNEAGIVQDRPTADY